MAPNSTFLKITNRDLYDKINNDSINIHKKLDIIENHAIQTNGKVKLNKWIATTALAMITILMGIMGSHMMGG